MNCSVEIIRKDQQSTSSWSGGTTTQLAIYPKTADYKARNFKWRLSSARVDIDESTFTSLPGIQRHIMIIEGEMKLIHEGHHSVLLKPFEQDSFSGGWITKSIGRARDFNLMLAEGCKGRLQALYIGKGMRIETEVNSLGNGFSSFSDAFYCAKGSVSVVIKGMKPYMLYEGDLLLLNAKVYDEHTAVCLECISGENADIIKAEISY